MINVVNLPLSPYRPVLERQRSLHSEMVERKRAGQEAGPEWVLTVEHEPVVTLGKHAEESNLINPGALQARGIECIRIERGGDVTYHGPGQLVVYPLIDLEAHRLGVKAYVNLLEEAVIRTLDDYGLIGERVEGASGVWLGTGTPSERKICALGVKCTRFITMHGLALNVNTDMSPFTLINPCGFTDKGVTSLALELGHTLDMEEVRRRLTRHLLTLLG